MLPAGLWDFLEITLGAIVLLGVMVQRRFSEKFNWSSSCCSVDSLFILLGQVGIVGVGTLAALVMVDGLWPGNAPPRTFVVLFLLVYAAIQARTFYQAITGAIKRSMNAVIG